MSTQGSLGQEATQFMWYVNFAVLLVKVYCIDLENCHNARSIAVSFGTIWRKKVKKNSED